MMQVQAREGIINMGRVKARTKGRVPALCLRDESIVNMGIVGFKAKARTKIEKSQLFASEVKDWKGSRSCDLKYKIKREVSQLFASEIKAWRGS